MNIENPAAFSFIMHDEIYLLNNDKTGYSVNTTTLPTVQTPPLNFNYLGGDKKNFLVMVHYTTAQFINDTHLTALENILKRMQYSLDDVAIFNIATYAGVTFEQLMEFFKPQKLLLLGENAIPAGTQPLVFNKLEQLNNCNTLFSFGFDEMMNNNENKKVFWEQMKQL